MQPKPGFGIGNQDQGPISVLVSEPFYDGKYAPYHIVHFWVILSKIVIYDLWLFQIFLAFFNSLYQELSGYVSHISLVLHMYPQEVQEQGYFAVFLEKSDFYYWPMLEKRSKISLVHICAPKLNLWIIWVQPTCQSLKIKCSLVHSKCRAKNVQKIWLL